MKKLEVNIETNEKEIIAGTVKWLKRELENIKFRFGSTKTKEPCIVADFFEEKEGKRKKTHSQLIAFVESSDDDSVYYIKYRANIMVVPPAHSFRASLFNYLTPAAYNHCENLIEKLADKLIEMIEMDKEDLTITVTTTLND